MEVYRLEEKKTIEYLKRHIIPVYGKKGQIEYFLNDIVLNLIEKQSKEIEELTDKNKKLKDKAKELIFEKQELTSALLDSTPNDKIKAKIEEYDMKDLTICYGGRSLGRTFQQAVRTEVKNILQSLLEKE